VKRVAVFPVGFLFSLSTEFGTRGCSTIPPWRGRWCARGRGEDHPAGPWRCTGWERSSGPSPRSTGGRPARSAPTWQASPSSEQHSSYLHSFFFFFFFFLLSLHLLTPPYSCMPSALARHGFGHGIRFHRPFVLTRHPLSHAILFLALHCSSELLWTELEQQGWLRPKHPIRFRPVTGGVSPKAHATKARARMSKHKSPCKDG